MSTKTVSAAIAAILTTAVFAAQAQAWGAAHAGYTHVGPNGVQHASYSAAGGSNGAYGSAHASAYGSSGAYHASSGAAYGSSSGGAYHSYSTTQSGGYAAGGYHATTSSAGVYRGY